MVLSNFWNPLVSLIPFWRAALALGPKYYDCIKWKNPFGYNEEDYCSKSILMKNSFFF
jgi:hypothetical protein